MTPRSCRLCVRTVKLPSSTCAGMHASKCLYKPSRSFSHQPVIILLRRTPVTDGTRGGRIGEQHERLIHAVLIVGLWRNTFSSSAECLPTSCQGPCNSASAVLLSIAHSQNGDECSQFNMRKYDCHYFLPHDDVLAYFVFIKRQGRGMCYAQPGSVVWPWIIGSLYPGLKCILMQLNKLQGYKSTYSLFQQQLFHPVGLLFAFNFLTF